MGQSQIGQGICNFTCAWHLPEQLQTVKVWPGITHHANIQYTSQRFTEKKKLDKMCLQSYLFFSYI